MSATGDVRAVRCPECGSGNIDVMIIGTLSMYEDGSWSIPTFGEAEGDKTECTCISCDHVGEIREFDAAK